MLNFLYTPIRWLIFPCIYLNGKVFPSSQEHETFQWMELDDVAIVNYDYQYTISVG